MDPFEEQPVDPHRITLPPDHDVHITGFVAYVRGTSVVYDESAITERSWHPYESDPGGILIITTADDYMYAFDVKDTILHMPSNVSDVKYQPVKRTYVHIIHYRYKLLDVIAVGHPKIHSKGSLGIVYMSEQYYRPTKDPNVVEIVTRPKDGRVPDDYVIFVIDTNEGSVQITDHNGIPLAMVWEHVGLESRIPTINKRKYRGR